ncbi:lipopolysaccharide assembly protein LapB [Pedobacter sp. L105]|uniref:tetratricopeptide repeat protein n=1 Tax=Pedobacter sp. L105 TaxID=1641871 RepID=UPI00131EB314|nr:tetratricopeptide repeat protein [Pedobacter sp. L105]
MKKVLLSMLFLGAATYANAQKSEVTKAKNAWTVAKFATNGKQPLDATLKTLEDGVKTTDNAIANEKSKDMPEAWSYRALFASRIAFVDTVNVQNAIANEKIAEDAITKGRALDTKGAEKENFTEAEQTLNNALRNRAIVAYNKKDFKSALEYFNEITAKNPQDTSTYVNAGVTAKQLENYPEMVKNFNKAIDLNYKDSESLYSEVVATTFAQLKDTVAGSALLEKAIAKYPEDKYFIGMQTDLYIKQGNVAKSQEMLTKLIAKDDKNAAYQYAMGDTYYKQALDLQVKRNKIDAKNKKEFETVTTKMTGFIDQALPYYKKAYELDPKMTAALENLKIIYAFKNDTVNYEATKKLLDAQKK